MKTFYLIPYRLLKWPSISDLAHEEHIVSKVRTVLHFYYFGMMYLAVLNMQWGTNLNTRNGFEPIWILSWLHDMPFTSVASIFYIVAIGGMFLGGLSHWWSIGRFMGFVGIWALHAMESSFGQPNHQWYPWLFTSFLLIFLPGRTFSEDASYEAKRKILLLLWSAQAMFLLTYSMSGLQKIRVGVEQLLHGEVGAFGIGGFSMLVANWHNVFQAKTDLGWFIIQNPEIASLLYLGAIYLEFFALWSSIRPSIQRLWAVGLVTFHMGTYLFMGILFTQHVLLLIVLFFFQPFVAGKISIEEMILDIPLAGGVYALFKRLKTNPTLTLSE